MKVSDLLTDEKRWTKGAYAKNRNGISMPPDSEQAECWCLGGALIRCYGNGVTRLELQYKVFCYINKELFTSVAAWNDHPDRTFEDVKNLIQELNI